MSKGRKTTTIGLRLPDEFIAQLEPKAKKKGITVTAYLKDWVLKEALRTHHKAKENINDNFRKLQDEECSLCGKPLGGEQDPHQACVDHEKYLADRQKLQNG